MKTTFVLAAFSQAAIILGAAIRESMSLPPEIHQSLYLTPPASPTAVANSVASRAPEDNWNAAAWSNFVKSYVDDFEAHAKRDENWNAVAWSNFVKSYVDDVEARAVGAETKSRRDENWNAAAWSNFIKSYVDDFEAHAQAKAKREGENWNAAAWSNFVKSYVDGADAV